MPIVLKRLNPKPFARIHRSFMVNLGRINTIEATDAGDYRVYLKCGTALNVSRRYRERVKGLMG